MKIIKAKWHNVINKVYTFMFGQRCRGEAVSDEVLFYTTYPDQQLSENDWYKWIWQNR